MIEHVHHWMVATPDGVECEAYCKCGQTRMFASADDGKTNWRRCKKCSHAYNSPQHKAECK